MGITVKMSFEGKASRKLANGQNIDYSEKENGPRASSAPAMGLNTIIFKHVYWYMLQISGERLQDHWSSGVIITVGSLTGGLEDVFRSECFIHSQRGAVLLFVNNTIHHF